MSSHWKANGSVCLALALAIGNSAQAQSRLSANAPTAPAASTSGALFTHWDKDSNKALSLDEFKAGWQELQASMALRQLHDNFVAKDANKNDNLDVTEYANLELIKQVGKAAPPLSAFDVDKNQTLDFKEYVPMVSAMLKSNPQAK